MSESSFASPAFKVSRLLAVLSFMAGLTAGCLPAHAQHGFHAPPLSRQLRTVLSTADSDSARGSTFVPFDSWIYPAFERLFSLGYADSAYLGLRPWTRLSCLHILEETYPKLQAAPQDREAWAIFDALARKFGVYEMEPDQHAGVDSLYVRPLGIAGTPINDSYHFGQTLINDDGRPYQEGFNAISGFNVSGVAGRLSLQVRGEYQHAPGRGPYPDSVEALIAGVDNTPIQPAAPLAAINTFRLLDANLSFHLWQHEISVGKVEDNWGPAKSGGMALSLNATPFYALRINRVEPLRIPLLSDVIGPVRYEGILGDLKGHRYPNAPWIHAEKFSFKPLRSLEFGFSRVVVFAGEGHVPLTFGSFWNSFSSFSNVSVSQKQGRDDPGARHSSFDFTWRLPWIGKWATLYSDSIVHDDVSPLSAPRRAAVSPGIYLSHLPRLPHVDFRVEAVSTDPVANSQGGQFLYYENVYRDGYLNHGNLLGSWMGRQGKGGQAWITDWLSPETYLQIGYRRAKVSRSFIPGGTTQNDYNARAVLRLKQNIELNAFAQFEQWTVPALAQGRQNDFAVSAQITYFPRWHWQR